MKEKEKKKLRTRVTTRRFEMELFGDVKGNHQKGGEEGRSQTVFVLARGNPFADRNQSDGMRSEIRRTTRKTKKKNVNQEEVLKHETAGANEL